jgi:hypothetical protein
MKVDLIMAEFGYERKNAGGNTFSCSRLDPTLSTFKRCFPEANVILYTDMDIESDEITVKKVEPPFDKDRPRYGWECSDYYRFVGLIESEADVAIYMDSDFVICSPEFRTLPDITKRFGVCVPQNVRGQVRVDGVEGAGSNWNIDEDESRGNCTALNASPVSLYTSCPRGRKLIECVKNQMLDNPTRGPLAIWRGVWESGVYPCVLPLNWCLTSNKIGTPEKMLNGRRNEICLHVGHKEVQEFYGVEL